MTTQAEALQKAAKLLRLSKSDNPHEAALAAARAQEILDRHQLTTEDVNLAGSAAEQSNEPIEDFCRDPLTAGRKLDRWRAYLAAGIASQNACKVYNLGGALCLIGRASDVSAVRYIFTWLEREVERLANEKCKGCGRTYWNNFRIGAVETITRRLHEQKKSTFEAVKEEAAARGAASVALVVRNNQLMKQRGRDVELWTAANMNLRAGGSYRTNYNESARQAGRAAGHSVRLNNAGNVGGGRRQLNG